MSEPEVIVVADAAALADAAAARIERVALTGSLAAERPVSIALAGGSTPRATYQQLAGRCPPWGRIAFLFGDERCVAPDHEASNYRMTREALFDRVPLREGQVHRIRGELAPGEAAAEAERDLRAALDDDGGTPRLDLVLLGMGADGHTASLFPGAPELEERERLMVPVHRPELSQPWRVSMTLPVLNAARRVLVVVADGAKAPMVARALAGDPEVPAGRVRPRGSLTWVLTEAAAAAL